MIIAIAALLTYIAVAVTWVGILLLRAARRPADKLDQYLDSMWHQLGSLDTQVQEINENYLRWIWEDLRSRSEKSDEEK